MDGEPIEDEFDATIPVDEEDDVQEGAFDEELGIDDEGLGGSVYSEPREGPGPDLTDNAQDEHPSPPTSSSVTGPGTPQPP